ncbi:FecR family protein [bacterium A37T11]|nr:FecR family protein [bacterium A37T11]
MKKQEIIELFKKYRAGTLSDEEQAKLESWYMQYAATSKQQADPAEMSERLRKIAGNLPLTLQTGKSRRLLPYLSTAAALLIAGAGIYFYKHGLFGNKKEAVSQTIDIGPGSYRATLTLADGRKIDLDSAKAGIQVNEKDMHYNDGTNIHASIPKASSITYNSLTTPKGGQYQIILSDGTKVWLNAASTLTYPSKFSGTAREVFLNGEAFFEINSAAGSSVSLGPFKVISKNQSVTVLGTTFNLSAYTDEPFVKTTLVAGSVQVASQQGSDQSTMLTPGQQAINSEGKVQVKTVNLNSEIAWRKGLFRFNKEPLESVMRQVSRWYNVEVQFENESLKTETIEGIVNRFSNLNTLLNLFEIAGDVQFTLQNHTLTVRKKQSGENN